VRTMYMLLWVALLATSAAAQPIIIPLSPQPQKEPPPPPPPSPVPVAPPQAGAPSGAARSSGNPEGANATSHRATRDDGASQGEGETKSEEPER